ncbi:MAG: MFS transporter [Chloroflexi bacterium]|nr:MFS transporter [Chloroflexota bacterium]
MSQTPSPQRHLAMRPRERLPRVLYSRPMRRVFAGWWIAAAASMASFAAVTFFNPVLGAITPELQAEYGWSTASIALTMVIGGIGGGVIATFVGHIADRHGWRWLLF